MSSEGNLVIEENRAAALVGVSIADLRRLARMNELGHPRPVSDGEDGSGEGSQQLQFTYEELAKLGFLAARSTD